jgi:hypothetical protein
VKALFAIALNTIRGALRSHVVHVLLGLVLLTVVLLPLTLMGDGTAGGQLQLALTYTLGLVGLLLTMATVWLGCTQVAEDIDSSLVQMLVVKPVPRWLFWLGKLSGLLVLMGGLLAVSASVILAMVWWRFNNSNFEPAEKVRMRQEVLVGRRLFAPEQPDMEALMREEYERRKKAGELREGMPESVDRNMIRRDIKAKLQEIPYAMTRGWRFENLPHVAEDDYLFLRYRLFRDKAKSRERFDINGVWVLPHPEDQRPMTLYQSVSSHVYHELPIPGKYLKDGRLLIGFENRDMNQKSVIVQLNDGPFLMVKRAGFANNFARAVFVIFLQICFVGIVATSLGAAFSTPVAIFMAMAYLLVGFCLDSLQPALPEHESIPVAPVARFGWQVQQITNKVVVSVNEFSQVDALSKGQLIEFGALLTILFHLVILRGLPFGVFAIWALRRRELGAVMRS